MKRKIVVAVLTGLLSSGLAAGSAVAAEQHPPKFGVKSTQCGSGANQPNCPGSH